MVPDLSAVGMKIDGRRRPRFGWFQQISASSPTIRLS